MTTQKIQLELHNIVRIFDGRLVVDGVSLSLRASEVTCLLGPSGCGKSTTLRIAAGVDRQSSGQVVVSDEIVSCENFHIPPEGRGIGLMFQDFALFPHLNVERNVAFGLRGSKIDKQARVADMLNRVGMSAMANQFPHQLSGGEQQRIAIARALLNDPELILADEPTGNLDPQTSSEVMQVLKNINATGKTIIMATHDYALLLKYPSKTLKFDEGKVFEVVQRTV